jgi:hypothetical protein
MHDTARIKAALDSIRHFFMRRTVKILLSLSAILFAVCVLGFLLYREKDTLLNYHWQFHIDALVISFFLYLVDLILVVWVWAMIMRSLGSRAGFWQHFRNIALTNVAKRLPGTIWYVLWRGEQYQPEGTPPKITVLASGMEISVSIIGGVLTCTLFAAPILIKFPTGITALAVMLILCLLFLHPKTIKIVLKLLSAENHNFHYWSILGWIGIYIVIWSVGGLILFSITNIIYPIIRIDYISYIIGSWSLVGILSFVVYFLPSNLGFNEIGISLLLSSIIPSSIAVIIAILSRALVLFYEIVMASVWWGLELRKRVH